MKNMKKVIAGLLLVTVLCGVTACGGDNNTNNKDNTTTTEDRKDDNRDTNKEDGLIEQKIWEMISVMVWTTWKILQRTMEIMRLMIVMQEKTRTSKGVSKFHSQREQ